MLFIIFDNTFSEFNNPNLQVSSRKVIEVFNSIYYYS